MLDIIMKQELENLGIIPKLEGPSSISGAMEPGP